MNPEIKALLAIEASLMGVAFSPIHTWLGINGGSCFALGILIIMAVIFYRRGANQNSFFVALVLLVVAVGGYFALP
ncbi:MAG: hypothetical protein WC375_05285 [Methanomassiliicoccales archaeon]|jgi:CDP-diglyceride synthetase